jgi:L-ascorbate metabolism protein UlaG (beta-lactamase superfamily)
MTKYIFFIVSIFSAMLMACASTQASLEVVIKWFGQASFGIISSQKTVIVIDPLEMGEYKIPADLKADAVTISHEHFDHNKVEKVSGSPKVFRGLASGAFNKIDAKVKDIRIFNVKTSHDPKGGKERGVNSIFIFEFDGIRIAHCGDLGQILTDAQLKEIGKVDILMIPIGGKFTIDPKEASKVVEQINPSLIVFPMHYKTKSADFLPFSADDFVKGMKNVKRSDTNEFRLNLKNKPKELEYVVLNYR